MDWFKIGKGVWQGCILSPWLFNLHVEYIKWSTLTLYIKYIKYI